jgi:hypothetical protein
VPVGVVHCLVGAPSIPRARVLGVDGDRPRRVTESMDPVHRLPSSEPHDLDPCSDGADSRDAPVERTKTWPAAGVGRGCAASGSSSYADPPGRAPGAPGLTSTSDLGVGLAGCSNAAAICRASHRREQQKSDRCAVHREDDSSHHSVQVIQQEHLGAGERTSSAAVLHPAVRPVLRLS